MKGDFTQSEYNPFDSPVPGQSLTDKPGNYPWEHAPQYTDVDQVLAILRKEMEILGQFEQKETIKATAVSYTHLTLPTICSV